MSKNNYSLVSQIRYKVSIRILSCFLLTLLTLAILTFLDVTNNIHSLKKELNTISSDLGEYIISQVLLDNEESVYLRINELESSYPLKIIWHPDKETPDTQRLKLHNWVNWEYKYNLESLDHRNFGTIDITGSFIKDRLFISELMIRALLVLSFFFFLFILLFPLIKKIPKEMLLNPILDILSLLKNPESYFKNENIKKYVEVEEIMEKIIYLIDQIKKDSHDAAIGKMAVQVAHDIRSPLAALDVAIANTSYLPENHRLIVRNAAQRINDIANNLLGQHKTNRLEQPSDLHKKPTLIMTILDSLLSEKRVQFANLCIAFQLNIEENAHFLFANINSIEFKRVISNLINNSIEATHQSGDVTITLMKESDYVVIKIIDNGCGIPQDILTKLSSSSISFGKKNGSGLGLYHAFAKIKDWKGKIEITSVIDKGTTVSIHLPIATPPSWVINKITIYPGNKIIIFDDDTSVHHVWSQRFASFKDKIEIIHFSSSHPLREWINMNHSHLENCLFLMDYELIGEIETGLNLIDELNLSQHAILVTSHFEENNLLDRCMKLNMRLLPKLMSAHISIELNHEAGLYYDAILIDDDPLAQDVWRFSADANDKVLTVFSKVNDFILESVRINKSVAIYIDSNLGNGVKGEIMAKELYEMGFKHIYLVTGENASKFASLSWLKGTKGKLPPWENGSI